jgi:hypothetical protein
MTADYGENADGEEDIIGITLELHSPPHFVPCMLL